MSGERGPLTTPIDINEARGNPGRRKRKDGADGEDRVEAPTRPRWLTGEARAEWNRTVAQLRKSKRLAKTDRAVLTEYCVTWARWVDVELHLGTGYLAHGSMGQTVRSPLFDTWVTLNARLEALSKALGLHVNARVRLPAVEGNKAKSELEEMLLNGRKRA